MEWNNHIYAADGLAVCFMAHSDGKDDVRDEANAALIAAAPDLLALAVEFRADVSYTLEKLQEFMLVFPDDHPDVVRKNAQIAKAKERLSRIDAALAKMEAA